MTLKCNQIKSVHSVDLEDLRTVVHNFIKQVNKWVSRTSWHISNPLSSESLEDTLKESNLPPLMKELSTVTKGQP